MKKIALIFTGLVKVDENLVGTAVVYKKLAELLFKQGYQVQMVLPELSNSLANIASSYKYETGNNKILITKADLIIFGAYPPIEPMLEAHRQGKIIMSYLWSIAPIGSLEFKDFQKKEKQARLHQYISASYNLSLLLSNKIFCRDEGIRNLVLGSLISLGRINLDTYQKDRTLRNLIDLAPFGIEPLRGSLKKNNYWQQYQGIEKGDFILIWNGGIWNWNDGVNLIKAIALLKNKKIKLVFQGYRSPDPKQKLSLEAKRTINLAKQLDLYNKQIFFIADWVPFEKRLDYLLASDLAVVSSPNIPEANLFFKTRIYDYLWANLPIILADIEAFAPSILGNNLGLLAKTSDPVDWAKQISRLARDKKLRKEMSLNILKFKKDLSWDKTLKKVLEFVKNPKAHSSKIENSQLSSLQVKANLEIIQEFEAKNS